eukprot:GHVU01056802.1.p1 GENE.GHVU01056802.1~~GHVU01056802.1.p1  ORF type:complete len:272 (+),score=11.49 GHVU01056802.1:31-846(+)
MLFILACVLGLAVSVPTPRWSSDCGFSQYADAGGSAFRIVNGVEARINEFPYQLNLGYPSNPTGAWCGAVLINDKWGLTAAHCMAGESASAVEVRIGAHDRTTRDGIRSTLLSFLMHAGYNSNTLENDIAVIEFPSIGEFNAAWYPACQPNAGNDYAESTSVVSGWGTTSSGGSQPSILRYTRLPVMTELECADIFGPGGFRYGMMCAGWRDSNPSDSCQGDSGGPLTVKNGSGRFEIVGLVSWGYGCASTTPGVYTRVSFFEAWINLNIN